MPSSGLSVSVRKQVSFIGNLTGMERLSDWINRMLAAQNRSKADLARFANTSRANVTLWTKKGTHVQLKTENLFAIAKFFGVDVSEVPGVMFDKAPKQRAVRKPALDDPFPNADAAMLSELNDIAALLPVTRKAKLLELARSEVIAWKIEQLQVKSKGLQ